MSWTGNNFLFVTVTLLLSGEIHCEGVVQRVQNYLNIACQSSKNSFSGSFSDCLFPPFTCFVWRLFSLYCFRFDYLMTHYKL